MDQIYLDYAGTFRNLHSIHHLLNKVEPGQSVTLCKNNSRLEIHNENGNCLARLSNEGFNRWSNRLDTILDIKVIAMLQRNQDDPDEHFQRRIKAEKWELPILEVIYSSSLR